MWEVWSEVIDMRLLEMSISGGIMVLVILLLRLFLLGCLPKRTFVALWGITLLRLLTPYRVSSVFSVYNLVVRTGAPLPLLNPTVVPSGAVSQTTPTVLPDTVSVQPSAGASLTVPGVLWFIGAIMVFVFFAVSYMRCRLKFQTSTLVRNEFASTWLRKHPLRRTITIRQSDVVDAPLTYGIVHPVILLPKGMDWSNETSLHYILTHEYIHICRFDSLFKLMLVAALCIHWFNPLVWVLWVQANRDLELSCDEGVIHHFGGQSRSTYARTLIQMEEQKSDLPPVYSSFSKNAIQERIVSIMKWKSRSVIVTILAAALVIGVGAALMTSSNKNPGSFVPVAAVLTTDAPIVDCYSYETDDDGNPTRFSYLQDSMSAIEMHKGDLFMVLGESGDRANVLIPYGDLPPIYGFVDSRLLSTDPSDIRNGNFAFVTGFEGGCKAFDRPNGALLYDDLDAIVRILERNGEWACVEPTVGGISPLWVRIDDLHFDFDYSNAVEPNVPEREIVLFDPNRY